MSLQCWKCKKVHDENTLFTGPPREGQAAVCLICAAVSKYDAELRLVQFTKEDDASLSPEASRSLWETVAAVRGLQSGGVPS
jgi:hypothetical protein